MTVAFPLWLALAAGGVSDAAAEVPVRPSPPPAVAPLSGTGRVPALPPAVPPPVLVAPGELSPSEDASPAATGRRLVPAPPGPLTEEGPRPSADAYPLRPSAQANGDLVYQGKRFSA